jgi:flagellar hook-associated protein 1 FlgK
MSSDLLSIASSGARAARIALDVTAQNITNAASEGYVRRSATLTEVSSTGYAGQTNDVSLSGVRVDKVARNADAFRQSEVRRTGSDTARAQAEVTGLQSVEAALEQSNVYGSITEFESSVQKLKEDPVDTSLRASVIETARTMTGTFQIAAKELDAVGSGLQFQASDAVTQVNRIGQELARTNLRLSRASDSSSDQTTLLDQRDKLLQDLSGYADITTTFAKDGTVAVQLGTSATSTLVQGGTADTLTTTTAANGTLSFSLATAGPVTLTGGSLTGQAQALTKLAQVHTDLDTLAGKIVTTINNVQGGGAALDGSAGQPLLSGTNAATIALATSDPAAIATSTAVGTANSRDPSNLVALQSALDTLDPAGGMDKILFDISGTVAGRTITRDALKTISDSATTALAAQSGVDLDTEAVNLVRFQQAFQASGKIMQVASTLFDTLLAIR